LMIFENLVYSQGRPRRAENGCDLMIFENLVYFSVVKSLPIYVVI